MEINAYLLSLSKRTFSLNLWKVPAAFYRCIVNYLNHCRALHFEQLILYCQSSNTFVSGAEGLRFKSQAGQIGYGVANGSPPQRNFFERSCVARKRNDAERAPQARYTLRRTHMNERI